MKKIGMTWKIHVRMWVHVAISSRFFPTNDPSSYSRTAMSQWPMTTTKIEATRRRSA
jgi:hypothetical protein